jgi:hypothetical protein
MARRIRILLADDNEGYFEDLKQDGHRLNVEIEHAKYLTTGITMLKQRGKTYGGAIVDINGLKDESQTIPKPDHLTECIKEFKKLIPDLPIVIATFDTQSRKTTEDFALDKLYDDEMPIFFKSDIDAPEKMFNHIKNKAKDLPRIKVQNEYSNIFEIFDKGYLGAKSLERIFLVIDGLKTGEEQVIQNNLVTFRHLLNDIFECMAKVKMDVIPTNLLDPNIKTGPIISYLRNSGEQGSVKRMENERERIYWSVPDLYTNIIHRIESSCGAHEDRQNFAIIKPTKYMYRTVFYAMMDYLLWFKGWMNENSIK